MGELNEETTSVEVAEAIDAPAESTEDAATDAEQ
jgi:hypothetical protein